MLGKSSTACKALKHEFPRSTLTIFDIGAPCQKLLQAPLEEGEVGNTHPEGPTDPFFTFSMSAAFWQDGDGVSFAPVTQTPPLAGCN